MQKWLARLSFSFLIIALFLAYEGYRLIQAGSPDRWRIGFYFVAAGLGIGLALRGVKERHRQINSDLSRPPPPPDDEKPV